MQRQRILLRDDARVEIELKDGSTVRLEIAETSDKIRVNYHPGRILIQPTGAVNELQINLIND